MGDHCAPVILLRKPDGVNGLAHAADLIQLYQNGVGDTLLYTHLHPLHVRHKEVIADKLHLRADSVGELLPAFPVVLGKSVLDGDNRILRAKSLIELDHLVRGQFSAFGSEVVETVLVNFAGSGVKDNADIFAGFVARSLNSLDYEL